MSIKFPLRSLLAVCLPALLCAAFVANPAYAKPKSKKHAHHAKSKKAVKKPEVAGEFANFLQWKEVAEFIDLMVTKNGFNKEELESSFRKVRYVESAIKLMKPAPAGKPKNWQAYRARFVEPVRVAGGVAFWDAHQNALARAEEQYGVPAGIIVGIIGVETIYGRNTGNFRVIDALTTLAFDYPDTPTRLARMQFFRGELENTFMFARDTGIDPFTLLGSYAGAVGWPQFMPSSIRQYAVDFDGDGKVDLRNSPVDAIGSVANFLVQHGWKRGQPIVFPANVTMTNIAGATNPWEIFIGQGLFAKNTLDELKTAGVTPLLTAPPELVYGLVDLQNGLEPSEYWLGGENFFAITQYNRSFFYAMSVVELSRAVQAARNHP